MGPVPGHSLFQRENHAPGFLERRAWQRLKRGKNPDALIEQVSEIDPAGRIDTQACRSRDLCVQRQSAVAAETSDASAGYRVDNARCRVDATNPIVHGVGDVDVPGVVHGCDAPRGGFNPQKSAAPLDVQPDTMEFALSSSF